MKSIFNEMYHGVVCGDFSAWSFLCPQEVLLLCLSRLCCPLPLLVLLPLLQQLDQLHEAVLDIIKDVNEYPCVVVDEETSPTI